MFKTHLAHDILLLCTACHVQCDMLVQKRMHTLSVLFDAPFTREENSPFTIDETLQKVSAARLCSVLMYDWLWYTWLSQVVICMDAISRSRGQPYCY